MFDSEFSIRGEFPPVNYDEWREVVEAGLKGAPFERKLVTRTYEGIDIQPIYSLRDQRKPADADGFPGEPPFVRGSGSLQTAQTGWDLRQEHAHPDLETARRAIQEDLNGGVTSLLLRLDGFAQSGRNPNHASAESCAADGLMVYQSADLEEFLREVDLEQVAVALDAGAAFLPAAAFLAAVWERRGIDRQKVRGAFYADPWAALAREGELPYSAEAARRQLAELAKQTANSFPNVSAVGVDTSPYHRAGATATQDIALAIATGVDYLRTLTETLPLDVAAKQIVFRISVGTHHFLSIAKLRAARRLWWRVIEASGGDRSSGGMRLHVRTSQRVLTERDPFVNLLRNTVGVFAAGIGGAECITSVPFDTRLGPPDEFSRRIARNTLLILQEEALLHKVADPAGGSWFLDHLTDEIAERAWEMFQEIERQGGILGALQAGFVAEQIEAAYAPRAKDISRRKEGITGVSEFPDIHEKRPDRTPVDVPSLREQAQSRLDSRQAVPEVSSTEASFADLTEAAKEGASIGELAQAIGFHQEKTSITRLVPKTFAEPFEDLRNASDQWQQKTGRRPRVFLANMGPVSHHSARATYSKNFFEAGGFEVISNDGFADAAKAAEAFRASGATIAVICSSDKLYPEMVPATAKELKAAGARSVVLAGHPGENETAWRDAGVDRFIFMKCDVLGTLTEMLEEEGVLES